MPLHDVSPGMSVGAEIGYDQITANVSITGTTSASPTTVITSSSYYFDGTLVVCQFFSPDVRSPSAAAANQTQIGLYESGSIICDIAVVKTPAAALLEVPVSSEIRFTPSAGFHTYVIAAWVTNTTGTPLVAAGNGSAGSFPPAFLRFTKA